MASTAALILCISLAGCELFNLLPRSKYSKTDVASSHKGGPSAEVEISFFSTVLADEAEGKPWEGYESTYEEYWRSRMQFIATHESRQYYERVWGHFNEARLKLGLKPVQVPSYDSFQITNANH